MNECILFALLLTSFFIINRPMNMFGQNVHLSKNQNAKTAQLILHFVYNQLIMSLSYKSKIFSNHKSFNTLIKLDSNKSF